RGNLGDTDKDINRQLKAAIAEDLKNNILCIGESGEEKSEGVSETIVNRQVLAGLEGLTGQQVAETILAYEPRWAIKGSGYGKPAMPKDAQEMAALIRATIAKKYGNKVAKQVRILYGGSADASNAKEYLSQQDVDGLLVGGKSISVTDFMPILDIAQEVGPTEGRIPYIGGNWKTYSIKDDYIAFAHAFGLYDSNRVKIGIAPSLSKISGLAEVFSSPVRSLKSAFSTIEDQVQAAISYLVWRRDLAYHKAVGAYNSAELLSRKIRDDFEFAPGHDVCEALRASGQAVIAVNDISYSQLEGHVRAAMEANAILLVEVARSQLGYALDQDQVMADLRDIMQKTGCDIPIVVHGDHIQYAQKEQKAVLQSVLKKEQAIYDKENGEGAFAQKTGIQDIEVFSALGNIQDVKKMEAMLKAEQTAYDKKYGAGSFAQKTGIQDIKRYVAEGDIQAVNKIVLENIEYINQNTKGDLHDIEILDKDIFEKVQAELKAQVEKERTDVTEINEKLIKAGFTSIAIDASTLYDEIGGDIVLDHYAASGTEAEKLVVKLEKEFELPLEWGVEILKSNPSTDKAGLEKIRAHMVSEMEKRGREEAEITARVKELENAFGRLVIGARESGIVTKDVINAYDKIQQELAEASIAGKIGKHITLSEKEKLMLLPSGNAAETAYQLQKIDEMVNKFKPELKGHFGKEVEVGHVDKTVYNPRRGMFEAKMTHPAAVRVMGEYLKARRLTFDLIATNNGSGHGTEFDKETLTPVSQVLKISPYLTVELQAVAAEFGAAIAQHGTSGSDDAELTDLSKAGVIKFNIATNYQQIVLNVLALVDSGLQGSALMAEVIADAPALMSGLHEGTRENIRSLAKTYKANPAVAEEKATDSLFVKFMKKTYAWGADERKGKIKESSGVGDIGKVLAKEFKRVFGALDIGLRTYAFQSVFSSIPNQVQAAISYLVWRRDLAYHKAVGAYNTAELLSRKIRDDFEFAPGHDVCEALRASGQA
ncbi:triose-phosphate isomerase, partial [bacterium]|nr:triose-phosphate isomerase [bacterium]